MVSPTRGYEFFVDRKQGILKIRAWGLWDVEFAEQYDRELQKRILDISKQCPQGWYALADLNDFPPQLPEVQPILVRGLEFGAKRGLKKEARLIGKALTKVQLARLMKEAGMPENSTFQTEDEAIKWLLSK